MRQHLTAVRAAAEICGADIGEVSVGSLELSFKPGLLRGGHYQFSVGSAGSAMLVLQTVLPALLRADSPSELLIEGGTHNPFAPPFDYVEQVWLPQLTKMGIGVSATLERHGFYPAGGGCVMVAIDPAQEARPLELLVRGDRVNAGGEILVSNLPARIGTDERKVVETKMSWHRGQVICHEVDSDGPGNLVALRVEHEHVSELSHGFGMKGVSGRRVASEAVTKLRRYIKAEAPVGSYLADQLMVPLALLAGGKYRTLDPSRHTSTNADVINMFLGPDSVRLEKLAPEDWLVEVGQ
jgi:RNA 3'-terminal phosphate cyclase (ATP)